MNGAEWLDACVFVAVGAQQTNTYAASTSFGQIELSEGKAVGARAGVSCASLHDTRRVMGEIGEEERRAV